LSFGEFSHYIEYVSRLVPQAPRTTSKRAQADDTSTNSSATKKPHHPSTHLGTQVIDSMLLGERINILCLPRCLFASLTECFFSFSKVAWLSSSRMRIKKMVQPLLLIGE
jgi:hypothetical protein